MMFFIPCVAAGILNGTMRIERIACTASVRTIGIRGERNGSRRHRQDNLFRNRSWIVFGSFFTSTKCEMKFGKTKQSVETRRLVCKEALLVDRPTQELALGHPR